MIKRPLFTVLISLITAVALLMYSGLPLKVFVFIYPVIVFLSLISSLASLRNGRLKVLFRSITLVFIGIIIALSGVALNKITALQNSEKLSGSHAVTAYTTEIQYNSDDSAAVFARITLCDGKRCNIPVYLTFNEKIPANKYAEYTLTASFSDISDFCDIYNTEHSFAAKSVYTGGTGESILTFTGNEAGGIVPFFGRLNEEICSLVSKNLDETAAALVNALLFGNTSQLDASIKRDFRTLGISHMLVVSGMNMALIAGELEKLLIVLKRKRKTRVILCSFICLVYMSLCGFTYTVIRAAVMQIMYRISILFRRDGDSYTSLFLSVAMICLVSPGAVFDIGLALSFFATLGIVSKAQSTREHYVVTDSDGNEVNIPIKNQKKISMILEKLGSSLEISLSACIFTLPICAVVFNEISLIGPFCTLSFAVFLDILLCCTPILLIMSVVPLIGTIISFAVNILCNIIISLTGFAFYLEDFLVSLSEIPTLILALVTGVLLLVCLGVKIKNKLLRVLPLLSVWIMLACICLVFSDSNGVFYYCEGNNEAILIEHERKTFIIDISSGSKTFSGKCSRATLSSLGNTNIDNLILTHLHNRHISEVLSLACDGYLKTVLIPEPTGDDEKSIYHSILTLSEKYGFDVFTYTDSVVLPEFELNSDSGNISSSKHKTLSFTLKLSGKKLTYLSSSSLESGTKIINELYSSDSVIIGTHPPKVSKITDFRLLNKDCRMIFADIEALKYFNTPSDNYIIAENGIALPVFS